MSGEQLWGPRGRTASGACEAPSPSNQQTPDPEVPQAWRAMARSIARSAAFRRALIVGASAVLVLHAGVLAVWGASASVSSNAVQVALDAVAVMAALSAAGRGGVFARRVWLLVAGAMAVHGLGQAVTTIYLYTGTEFFSPWWSDEFLFFWVTPLLVAVVADPLEPRRRVPLTGLLDFLQVLLLGVAWHFSVFGDPLAWTKDAAGMAMLTWKVRVGRDLFVMACLWCRAGLSEFQTSRRIFRALAIFFSIFALVDLSYLYCEATLGARFGTGLDLLWSLPRWLLVVLAVGWVDAEMPGDRFVRRRWFWLLHVASLIVPLLILFIAAHALNVSPFLQALLGASIACAGARVLVTQTQQERALHELTRSRNLLSAVIEGSSQAIYLKDLAGRFVLINSAGAKLLGRPKSEILGSRDKDVLPLSLLQHAREADQRVFATGQPCTEEAEMVMGMESRTLLSTKAPYFEAPGEVAGVLGIAVDITPLKETQKELVRWKNRCESALRASRHVMYELEPRSGRISIDTTFDRFLGYTAEEMPTRASQWRRLVHREDRGGCERAIGRAVRTGAPFTCEYRVRGKDGGFHHVLEHGQVFAAQGAKPYRIIGFVEDVTESRQAAERLKHAQRLESLGTLAAGVAHDFNNLLTVINGYSEVLLDRNHGAPVNEAADAIHQASNRAAGLVRQLLAFSRKQSLSPRILDLNQSVTGIYKMLGRLLPESIEIRMELDKEIGSVKADPGQLEQIIMNLAVNARDAMPDGGALTLGTYEARIFEGGEGALGVPPGDYVVLSVEDTGVGIAPEIQPLIFEPFFTTKEAGRGTGLGLATVHGIVTQSGGYIRVNSEPGLGTTFQIFLPKTAGRPASEMVTSPVLRRLGQESILLVEDDPSVRGLVATSLRGAGFEVTGVDDPRLALSLLERRHVDLVISDLMLPGMDGWEMSRRMREQNPGMRVIFITGYIDSPVLDRAMAGKATVLQKPFSSGRLLDSVRKTLDA